jgi:hypothetical protein
LTWTPKISSGSSTEPAFLPAALRTSTLAISHSPP